MRILALQHVPYENPGQILQWSEERGHVMHIFQTYQDLDFPDRSSWDLLVVMGGPMSVSDVANHPWLRTEIKWLRNAIHDGKTILGICLGSQLLARALGAEVRKNHEKEIGWFPVRNSTSSEFGCLFPDEYVAFHWHGDTFDLPEGSDLLASSEGCKHQGFVYEDRIIGLQYHLEVAADNIKDLIKHCSSDMTPGKYVQSPRSILQLTEEYCESIQGYLYRLLDKIEMTVEKKSSID